MEKVLLVGVGHFANSVAHVAEEDLPHAEKLLRKEELKKEPIGQ